MAALGIRLLGLATARRAMRRWFRRGWPLGDSSDEEDDGQAVPPAPPNTPADTSLVSETDDDEDNKEPQPEEPEEPEEPEDEDSEPYIDDSEYDQDFYNDSSTMSLNMFVPTVSGMQQAVAAPANAQEIEEPQQLPDAKAKETEQPQQLSDAKVDALTEQISKLNVARIDEPVVAVTKPLSTPGDDDATIAALTDPAVLAERAVHLKFIGEALDMVSCPFFSSSFLFFPHLPSLVSVAASSSWQRLLTSDRLLGFRPNLPSSPTRLPSAASLSTTARSLLVA